jgi:hypothetical protein
VPTIPIPQSSGDSGLGTSVGALIHRCPPRTTAAAGQGGQDNAPVGGESGGREVGSKDNKNRERHDDTPPPTPRRSSASFLFFSSFLDDPIQSSVTSSSTLLTTHSFAFATSIPTGFIVSSRASLSRRRYIRGLRGVRRVQYRYEQGGGSICQRCVVLIQAYAPYRPLASLQLALITILLYQLSLRHSWVPRLPASSTARLPCHRDRPSTSTPTPFTLTVARRGVQHLAYPPLTLLSIPPLSSLSAIPSTSSPSPL